MNRLERIENLTKNSPNRLRESYFIKNDIFLYNSIIEYTLNLNIPFKQKIWHWVNEVAIHKTCYCGKSLSFKMNWKDGYKEYCSNKCSSNSTKVKEKLKETFKEKYGVEHYSKTDEYKEKYKKSSIIKYGVDNYSKTDEYVKKSKDTYVQKYGIDNYTKTKEYLEKTINTNILRYGKTSHTKTEKYKKERKGKSIFKIEKYRIENFEIAKDKYYIKYLDNKESLFKCDLGKDHTFIINTDNYYGRIYSNNPLCTICYPIELNNSIKEIELQDFIEKNYDNEIIFNYKDKLEIDIYLPNLKIGFEFNGIWWHSDRYKTNDYHLNKTNYFKEKEIRIIHIWEDDWVNKKEIIKSQILNIVNKTKNKIWARKCFIKEVSVKDAKLFLEENHLQGFVKSNIKIGLYYNEELVAMMSFDKYEGRKKMLECEWNLNRFCVKNYTSVAGAASKLLSYFIKTYNPIRIVSYADKDWSVGNLYKSIGFTELYCTKSDYKYLINSKRKHKSKFRKSESIFMKNIPKVYDCGKIKFELLF
jgi:hypothetical protein